MLIHEVIYVVAVGNRLMTAPRPMHVVQIVARTGVIRGAGVWIGVRDLESMLIDMISMRVVQMTIVQVINVAIMFNRRMTTARTVLMFVIFVNIAAAHVSLL